MRPLMMAPLLLPPSPHYDGNASAIAARVQRRQSSSNDLRSFVIVARETLKLCLHLVPHTTLVYHYKLSPQ